MLLGHCLQQTGTLTLSYVLLPNQLFLFSSSVVSKKGSEAAYVSTYSALMNNTPQTLTLHFQVFLNHLQYRDEGN